MSPGVQPHEPADRERGVRDDVGDVEHGEEAPVGEHELLELRLDVEAEPALERDHALRVPRRLQPALLAALAPAGEQVEGVDAEADRDLAPAGEAPSLHRPPSHSSAHTYVPHAQLASEPGSHRDRHGRDGRVSSGSSCARSTWAWPGTRSGRACWTMIVALGLVVANVLIMSIRWGYLLAGAGFQIGLWKLDGLRRPRCEQHPPARGGDLLRIESMRERRVPVFVSAGTLFAERLLDGVILSAWILFGRWRSARAGRCS